MNIVTKKVLDLYDKYDEDFGLLDERWADKEDKKLVSKEQAYILGSYIDKLLFLKAQNLSTSLRRITEAEVKMLEEQIEQEVIDIIKRRMDYPST